MPQKEKKKKIIGKGIVLGFLVFCLVLTFCIKPISVNALSWELSSTATDAQVQELMNAVKTNDKAAIEKLKQNGVITDKGFLKQTGEFLKKWVWDKGGSAAFWSALKNALNTVAYDTATWIGSGGEGQKPMFITEGWGEYMANIGDNAAGKFIETLGKENGYLKFNLCEPDLAIKIKIGFGLVAQQRPGAPACTFSQMVKNWDQELQNPDFLPKFQDMFSPTGNDLVQALTLQTGIIEERNLEKDLKLEELKTKKGWLDVKSIGGYLESIPGYAENKFVQSLRVQETGFMHDTADAFEGAINVFTNQLAVTLYNKMMEKIGAGKEPSTSPYNWDNLATFEAGPTTGGVAAAQEKFRQLTEPVFATRGDYNILAELTQCPNPTKAGPTNCVITDNFNKAVSEKKTVGEAMNSGYLDANGVFGFLVGGAGGALEPAYNEGYPYRSMIILRKFRIIPAGWEVAAQYIKEHPTETDGTKNLGDLVNCFDPDDEYEGYEASWCKGLVDPTWVLKAPQNYCRREGPGPEIISESVSGVGSESELSLFRNESYCADEQSCIQEKDDGTCGAYGYCAEERRKWDFGSESCEPRYNTCQTFQSSGGSTVSYLENTLDYANCTADNAGCQWYCEDYDYEGSIAASGLVSYWNFNEGSGGTASDSAGGNNGTIINGATWKDENDCKSGKCLSFDGDNDYVSIAEPVPQNLQQIQNEITLEAWIYVTQYPQNRPPQSDELGLIIGSQYDVNRAGASIFLDGRLNPDGQVAPTGHIHFQIGDGANWHHTNVNASVPLNEWVHVAATRKANEDAKVYYNGISQSLTSVSWAGGISYNQAWFAIGRQKDSGSQRNFDGKIDEVAIFNRALSSDEISEHYNSSKNGGSYFGGSSNWTCTASIGNKLYFDKDVAACDADNAGCHEFIRIKDGTGANLFPNSSFETIGSSDAVDDGNSDTFVNWEGTAGEAVSGAYNGSVALKLTADLNREWNVGPADYSITGQTYTLSFFAKDCGASGQFGLDDNLSNLETSSDWGYFKLTNIYNESASGGSVNIKITGFGASCIIDAIKLEEGQGTAYSDYRGSGLVYEKFLPDYLKDICYNNAAGGDYTFKEDAPSECSDFARQCNVIEAGCEMFTSTTDNSSIPAKVIAQNYCPAECVGYDTYVQKETVFDTLRNAYFIPSTARSCSAETVGCDEFTNLDTVAQGGEGLEYYTYLKQCIAPSGDCAEFYTWEGSDETGYQLRVFSLKKDGNAPYLTNTGMYNEQECSEATYNLSTNPMCRQFYNTNGEEFYKFYPYTVTCSENCKSYRRTEKNIDPDKTDQASCGSLCSAADGQSYCWNDSEQVCYFCQNDGQWSVEHQACLYDAIPDEGETCSASAAGCREYTGNAGNNTMIVLNNDFQGSAQGWVGIDGTAVSVDNTALMVGGSSLKVMGGTWTATTTVGQLVVKGKTYVLSFIAKAVSGAPTLIAALNSGAAEATFSGNASLNATEWKFFKLNLAELDHDISNGEYLFIQGDANFYIDDIKLTEITDRYYLIKNSWATPDACFQDIYGNPVGALYNLGCDQYTDRGGETHYLHNFNQLCQESAVGCELMIDTHNSTNYKSETFNENNESEIITPADNYIYAVYDQIKECNSADKGCQYLGDPNIYGNEIMYSDKYLKNNPDTYGEIVCKAEEAGCEAWTTSEGSSYFKNPGSQTCEWRQSASGSEWRWYKMKVKRCGGALTGNLCATDDDCASSITCQTETDDNECPATTFETFGYGGAGNQVEQPTFNSQGYWAGLCPASESGCSEYIDPISKFSTNIIFNGQFTQDVDLNHIADGWSNDTNGAQDIELEPNTLYILAVEGENVATVEVDSGKLYKVNNDNGLEEILSAIVSRSSILGRTSMAFYVSSDIGGASIKAYNAADTIQGNNSKIELKKAAIDYQLRQDVDKEACNGVVNFEDGCVLFNERLQDGINKADLTWDADLTVVDGSGISPETGSDDEQDSNILLKVIPERSCDKWLACRSMVEVVKENGDKENVCFDIGLCNRFDDNGNCNNFVLEDMIEQTVDLPDGDFSKFNNITGYNKIGLAGVSDYTMNGLYPFGKMEQEGEVVDLPNSNFEFVGDNGYPIGWVWEGGVWTETAFKVIDNPYDAQVEGIGYAPEGRNFLKLGTSASATSEFGDVIGDTNYLLTAYINTINLAAGIVKAKVEQFDEGGNSISSTDAISQGSGAEWTFEVGSFTTLSAASRIKITLYSDTSTVGNYYFDDIKLRPALLSRDNWYASQTCRLYPKDDSLSCAYFEDSGIWQEGWWGYCLEYDRAPGSPDACVLWWPVDKVKGDGIEEGAGYTGEMPLYYCLEAAGYCGEEEPKAYCSKVAQVVTSAGQNKFWSGRVYDGTNYEIPFAASASGAYIDWDTYDSSTTTLESIILNYSRDSQPFGSLVFPEPGTNPYEWDSVPNIETNLDTEPLYVSNLPNPLTGVRAGTPYFGIDTDCSDTEYSSYSAHTLACDYNECNSPNVDYICPSGVSRTCLDVVGNCGRCSDGECSARTVTCTAGKLDFNIASSLSEGIGGVSRLFAQSYGGWEWQGDQNNGRYVASSTLNWGPPQNKCAGNVRPDYPNDLCAVLPTVTNIKVNGGNSGDIILTSNQFVNFTFNTNVDSQQMPMVMYGIDWGDNEKTVVSGVEMRAKPNADNPHSLYHLYGYWDLKAKNATDQGGGNNNVYCGDAGSEAKNYNNTGSGYTCSGSACCIVKPEVQIKDNWSWCDNGTAINDCDTPTSFNKWVVVKEK